MPWLWIRTSTGPIVSTSAPTASRSLTFKLRIGKPGKVAVLGLEIVAFIRTRAGHKHIGSSLAELMRDAIADAA